MSNFDVRAYVNTQTGVTDQEETDQQQQQTSYAIKATTMKTFHQKPGQTRDQNQQLETGIASSWHC